MLALSQEDFEHNLRATIRRGNFLFDIKGCQGVVLRWRDLLS